MVRGRPAARWAALTALAFSSSTLLQGERLNGEPVAAMFVMVSMALLLHAGHTSASTRTVTWLAVGSGVARGSVGSSVRSSSISTHGASPPAT